MAITEPATFITDVLISLCALYYLVRLSGRYRETRSRSVLCWTIGFGALAASALAGGIYHGSGYWFGEPVRDRIWLATLAVMVASGGLLLAAVSFSSLTGRSRSLLLTAAGVKAATVLVWVLNDPRFLIAIVDYASSMLCIVALALLRPGGGWTKPGRWLLCAIGLSSLGALVQLLKLAPSPHFNHNDLFHLVQLAANWLFYRAAKVSVDRNG